MAKRSDTDGGRVSQARPKATDGSGADKFNAAQFVTYALDPDEKLLLKERGLDGDTLDSELVRSMGHGMKLTIKWDEYSQAWAAWFVPTAGDETNKGLILSGRGSSPLRALRQLLYIHIEIALGDWRGLRSQVTRDDD